MVSIEILLKNKINDKNLLIQFSARRSRSVSNTRRPMPNYYYGRNELNDDDSNNFDNNLNNTVITNGASSNGVNFQDEIRRLTTDINQLSTQDSKSKSIESIINDSGLFTFKLKLIALCPFFQFHKKLKSKIRFS